MNWISNRAGPFAEIDPIAMYTKRICKGNIEAAYCLSALTTGEKLFKAFTALSKRTYVGTHRMKEGMDLWIQMWLIS